MPAKSERRVVVKEDVLDQVVDDHLQFESYFTTHNVRLRPRPDHPDFTTRLDAVNSDVDVVGYHPPEEGVNRVVVVTFKAWQVGFDATAQARGATRREAHETGHLASLP